MHKRKKRHIVLYATYCLLIFTQIFAFRTAGIGPTQRDTYIDNAAKIRIVVVLLIAVILMVLYLFKYIPGIASCIKSTGQKALMLFIGAMVISSIWSPLPLTAAFRITQLLVATFLIWYLLLNWDINNINDLLWKLCAPVLCFGIINGIIAPGKIEVYKAGYISYLYKFKENACGHVAGIALALCLIQLIDKNHYLSTSKLAVRFMLSLSGLILFRSATSWGLLYLVIFIIIIRSGNTYLVFLALSILIGSLIFVNPLDLASVALGGKNTENISTLTGRKYLYPVALSFALKSPIIGHGYLGDNFLTQFDKEIGWLPQNAHSGYLSAFINFGLIGLLLLIISIVVVYRELRIRKMPILLNKYPNILFQFRLVLIIIAASNFVESWIGDKFTLIWPFFAAASAFPLILKGRAISEKL